MADATQALLPVTPTTDQLYRAQKVAARIAGPALTGRNRLATAAAVLAIVETERGKAHSLPGDVGMREAWRDVYAGYPAVGGLSHIQAREIWLAAKKVFTTTGPTEDLADAEAADCIRCAIRDLADKLDRPTLEKNIHRSPGASADRCCTPYGPAVEALYAARAALTPSAPAVPFGDVHEDMTDDEAEAYRSPSALSGGAGEGEA